MRVIYGVVGTITQRIMNPGFRVASILKELKQQDPPTSSQMGQL